MKLINTLSILVLVIFWQSLNQTGAAEISSPDKRIVLRTHEADGQVAYSVEFNGTAVIAQSRLGVELSEGAFSKALTVSG